MKQKSPGHTKRVEAQRLELANPPFTATELNAMLGAAEDGGEYFFEALDAIKPHMTDQLGPAKQGVAYIAEKTIKCVMWGDDPDRRLPVNATDFAARVKEGSEQFVAVLEEHAMNLDEVGERMMAEAFTKACEKIGATRNGPDVNRPRVSRVLQ